jgi:regulatory protein
MTPPPKARAPRPAGKPPNAASLREAAIAHLGRYSATEAGLRRVLERRVDRWARRAETEGAERDALVELVAAGRAAAAEVARAMVAGGHVDDAAYAEARARRLARGGRSRRAIGAHLAAKGIAAEIAAAVLPADAESELDAALVYCRRRRTGPFARAPMDAAARLKALAALARNGFSRNVAERALDMGTDAAETRIIERRANG